jgi:hypothetical protein
MDRKVVNSFTMNLKYIAIGIGIVLIIGIGISLLDSSEPIVDYPGYYESEEFKNEISRVSEIVFESTGTVLSVTELTNQEWIDRFDQTYFKKDYKWIAVEHDSTIYDLDDVGICYQEEVCEESGDHVVYYAFWEVLDVDENDNIVPFSLYEPSKHARILIVWAVPRGIERVWFRSEIGELLDSPYTIESSKW